METQLENITQERNNYKQIAGQMQINRANDIILDKFTFLDPFLEKIKNAEKFTQGQRTAYTQKYQVYKHDVSIYKQHTLFTKNPEIIEEIENIMKQIEDNL